MTLAKPREGLSRRHPAFLISTWFGSGLLPIAPGTWGSAAALPFAWVILELGGMAGLAIATLLISLVGWWAADVYVRRNQIEDPGEIVVDEVAGQWLVLLAVPPGLSLSDTLILYGIAFLIFRLVDITKPWPARWADRHVKGGFGVMLDDLLAAAYGLLAMVLVMEWWNA